MQSPSKSDLKKTVAWTVIACGLVVLGLGFWIVRDQVFLLARAIAGWF